MTTHFTWEPSPKLLQKIIALAEQRKQPPEALVTEAMGQYLQSQQEEVEKDDHSIQFPQPDPLVGLFSGSPDLSTRAEEILELEITPQSGWTWKQP